MYIVEGSAEKIAFSSVLRNLRESARALAAKEREIEREGARERASERVKARGSATERANLNPWVHNK